VPLLKDTLDSQAWRFLSFGARMLYVALKRRVPPGRNVAYLSYRNAVKDLGRRSTSRIAEWYRELEHYGFIVLHRYGSLGVEGKGKAPQWRLTELGMTSKASPGGVFEPPTNDFLRWDGVLFEPKPRKRTPTAFPLAPVPVSGHPVVNLVMSTTGGTVKERSMSITGGTPKSGTVHNGGHTTVHNGGHRVSKKPIKITRYSRPNWSS